MSREPLHETHVCRDCGAEFTMPHAQPDQEPHEDTPTADLAAELLGSEWHEHRLLTPHGRILIWRHRHERP